jgi:hypothetical protein
MTVELIATFEAAELHVTLEKMYGLSFIHFMDYIGSVQTKLSLSENF